MVGYSFFPHQIFILYSSSRCLLSFSARSCSHPLIRWATKKGMRVYIDFSFTLLNREHFSANETFSGRQIKFTFDSPAQGNRRYIPVDDLYERNFTDGNGEFQLELTVANPRTLFETDLRLPVAPGVHPSPNSQQLSASPSHHHHHLGGSTGNLSTAHSPSHANHNSGHHQHQGHHQTTTLPKTTKMETTYFSFGGFDWNMSVVMEPYSVTAATSAAGLTLNLANNLGLGGQLGLAGHERDSPSHRSRLPVDGPAGVLGDHVGNGTLALRLRRLTGVDHRSRSRYYISVGEGDRRLSSGLMDDVSDAEGAGSVWCPRVRIQDVAPKGVLRLLVELVSANTLSETLITLAPNNQTGTPGGIGGLSAGTCYDRDKQAWSFEADTHSENGKYRIFHHIQSTFVIVFIHFFQGRSGSELSTATSATFRATTSGKVNQWLTSLIARFPSWGTALCPKMTGRPFLRAPSSIVSAGLMDVSCYPTVTWLSFCRYMIHFQTRETSSRGHQNIHDLPVLGLCSVYQQRSWNLPQRPTTTSNNSFWEDEVRRTGFSVAIDRSSAPTNVQQLIPPDFRSSLLFLRSAFFSCRFISSDRGK